MTLSDLGNLGEFIGAIAVILSLLYVAAQIRQNTRQVRASTFQGTTRGWQEFIYVITSDDRAQIWMKGNDDWNALSDEEVIKYAMITRAYLRGFENDYYQYGQGTFDSGPWEGYLNSFRTDCLARPGFRKTWELEREHFNSEFAALVDRELGSITMNEGADLTDNTLELGANRVG